MAAWPSTLPQYPLRDQFGEEAPFPVIQADNDGPPMSRRRYTAAPASLTHVYNMTAAQFATWETFYGTTLKYGSLTFTAPMRDSTSTTATYRIVGKPSYKRLGAGNWQVALKLIRLP